MRIYRDIVRSRIGTKIVGAALAVEILLIVLLVAAGVTVMRDRLVDQTSVRHKQVSALFNLTLAEPLISKDWGRLDDVLSELHGMEDIEYLVLRDLTGDVLLSAGFARDQPLPDQDSSVAESLRDDQRYDTSVEITFADTSYGVLHFGLSTAFVHQAIIDVAVSAAAVGGVIVVISGVLFLLLSRLLTRDLSNLTQTADALAKGELSVRANVKSLDEVGVLANAFNAMGDSLQGRIREMNVLSEKYKESARKLSESLHEKEVLLREVHHRTKNNVQVISSMLRMKTATVTDERYSSVLTECRNRIESMGLVHEHLYRSPDLSRISMRSYVRDLIANIESLQYGYDTSSVHVNVNIEDDMTLTIGNAIPCGLIINELVSNSFIHAFPDSQVGEVVVRMENRSVQTGSAENTDSPARVDGSTVYLEVSDNGRGLPDDFDLEKSSTLGVTLVDSLVQQLRGALTVQKVSGVRWIIEFFDQDSSAPPAE